MVRPIPPNDIGRPRNLMLTSAARGTPSSLPLLIGIGMTIAALYFGRAVFLPLAIAVLATFALAPIVSWLRRWRVPRPIAVISAVTGTLGALRAADSSPCQRVLLQSRARPLWPLPFPTSTSEIWPLLHFRYCALGTSHLSWRQSIHSPCYSRFACVSPLSSALEFSSACLRLRRLRRTQRSKLRL